MQHELLPILLQGDYSFTRIIKENNLKFYGDAKFKALVDGEILYNEIGSYVVNGEKQLFMQKRIFIIEQYRLLIKTVEQNILHTLNFSDKLMQHTHICGDDKYHLKLIISNHNEFKTMYNIIGPIKQFNISTKYYRTV